MAMERRPGYDLLVGRWTEEQHRATIADESHLYFLGRGEKGEARGFVILRDLKLDTQSLCLKRIAVMEVSRGFGRSLLAAAADWVFANTDTHRWLEVMENSARAHHVYSSLGWREEGTARKAFKYPDSTRGNYIQMSILKHEWKMP